jgi:hypothetical protein
MELTQVVDQAIQARMGLIVAAKTFDRLFAGIRFDELDHDILFVYAKDEETAAEVEDNFSLHIQIVAAKILKREVNIVMVLPKQFVY